MHMYVNKARWSRSAGNSAIENVCMYVCIIMYSSYSSSSSSSYPPVAKDERTLPDAGELQQLSSYCSSRGILHRRGESCSIGPFVWRTNKVKGAAVGLGLGVGVGGQGSGVGGVGCLYFIGVNVFGSFSLWESTCMHRVYLALWTRKILCGGFCAPHINVHSFIHSFIHLFIHSFIHSFIYSL